MEQIKLMVMARSVVDGSLPLPRDPMTGSPDLAHASWVLNPFDEVAIEAAVRLRATLATEAPTLACELLVVGYADSAGVAAVERALALGGDRALLLAEMAPSSHFHSTLTSQGLLPSLLELIHAEQPHLLLLGRMAYGQDQGELAPMLAGALGWPLAMAISEVTWGSSSENGVSGSAIQVLQRRSERLHRALLRLPAVVSCELDLATPRYLSLPALVAARRKPKQSWLSSATGAARPHLQLTHWQGRPARGAVQKLANVAALVELIQAQTQSAGGKP